MGEVINFVPGLSPKLAEAIDTALLMSHGRKCAHPGCTMDGNGCSEKGCLLYLPNTSPSEYTPPIDGDCA